MIKITMTEKELMTGAMNRCGAILKEEYAFDKKATQIWDGGLTGMIRVEYNREDGKILSISPFNA